MVSCGERRDLDEQDTKQRVLKYHEEHVSRMLTWVGIEEERSVYLGDYNNVVRDLADPSLDDWALVRAAMLHIALFRRPAIGAQSMAGARDIRELQKKPDTICTA